MENEEIKEENIWLEEELREVQAPTPAFEKLPSPRLEDGKVTRMKIDLSKKFDKWTDDVNKKVKAIIPCDTIIDGKLQRANFWLNTRNPLFRDILNLAKEKGIPKTIDIAVMQTGKEQATKYILVKE